MDWPSGVYRLWRISRCNSRQDYCDVKWLDKEFTLIDTGGIEFRNEKDQISSGIRQQAELAMEEADVILFVVDARTGMTSDDETIAGLLRKTGKPVVLAVNKVDSDNQEMDVYEFYSLGLGDPIGISAVNRLNFGDLLDRITEGFPNLKEEESEDIIRTAIVGRPNVGKSTLINSLLGYERSWWLMKWEPPEMQWTLSGPIRERPLSWWIQQA